MNPLFINSLKVVKYFYSKTSLSLFKKVNTSNLSYEYQNQEAGDYIRKILSKDEPCLISRFGSNELAATLTYLNIIDNSNFVRKIIKYVQGESEPFWWDKLSKKRMQECAGFFSENEASLEIDLNKFGQLMLDSIQEIDILGSWINSEIKIRQFFPNAVRVPLSDLEPYCHKQPWSEVLEGKTVLVIHPFEESIQRQYMKRILLFSDSRVLPKFELKTIKAVQSIANNSVDFSNWFEALNYMFNQACTVNFDVAIIGAGAYGLPLGALIKKTGKKVVHLGAATQILFGIRGKRWDERLFYQNLFNEHWERPLTSEQPQSFQNVEGGCYW